MSVRPSEPDLLLYRCPSGHAYFVKHARCPECDLELAESRQPPAAVIVSQTTVRVNPTGAPFRLGVAEVQSGAKTLCVIRETVPEGDLVSVTLERRGDLYHALERPAGNRHQ
jgi:uncharacterized OB-fold protein